MKTLAAITLALATVAPATASAEYLCNAMWNAKHGVTGASCPAGSTWDGSSCVAGGS
ncbi:MAG: hypothetical protein AAF626_03930 [Pseudomonadota bacterium]